MCAARTSKYKKLGYELDKESLKKLEIIMKELIEENPEQRITYSVHFEDDTRVTEQTLEQLLERPNIGKKTINFISVGTTIFRDNSLLVSFSNANNKSIQYELSVAKEKDFPYFEEKIDTYIASLKTKYSFIAISKVWYLILVVLFSNYFSNKIIAYFFSILSSTNIQFSEDSIWYLILNTILSIIVIMLIGLGALFIQNKYFPVATFKFGSGIKIAKHNIFIRNSIILASILSVITALFLKFI